MKLKIFYRSSVVWNILLFLMLSVGFAYLQYVSSITSSAFSQVNFKNFANLHILYLCLIVFTGISFVNNMRKISGYLLIGCVLFTWAITTINLVQEFSKFSLILLFFYLVVAYYFYLFYYIDVKESYYNPGFPSDSLFEPMLKKIPVQVFSAEEKLAEGCLTNWSKEGCFIYSDPVKLNPGKYTVKIQFLGGEFAGEAILAAASKSNMGYGFKFKNSFAPVDRNSLGWESFYEIIDEMGYAPELLK